MPLTCIPGSVLCGLGIAEILLWILVFAIVFGVLNMLCIFGKVGADGKHSGKKINALVALVVSFFVLMSIPLALISVITSMVNSFVILAIVLVVLSALLSMATCGWFTDKDGWQKYAKYVAIVLVIIAIWVFIQSGGLALIGLSSLPALGITLEMVIIAILVLAVLWLIFS